MLSSIAKRLWPLKRKKERRRRPTKMKAAEVDRGKRKVHKSLEDDEDALDEPERPLKRLRRRGEAGFASASNCPNLKETTTHDQETAPVLLPFHPLPTENDPDAGALIMPKDEPCTDIPFTSTHQESLKNGNSSAPMSEMEETNGHLEERDGETVANVDGASHNISTTTIERSREHKLATTPEGSSTLELASSATGEVKINLSFAPATGGSSLHAPSMDELRRAMEDVCLRQYKIVDPNFSVSRILNDIASCYLERQQRQKNQPTSRQSRFSPQMLMY